MKIKKVLAGALAAAMALTTMVTTSFTASAADEPLHKYMSGIEGDNSSVTGIDDITQISQVVANIVYTNCNQYSNGKFTFNSNGGWKETTYGTGEQNTGGMVSDTSVDVTLDVGEVTDWFQFGISEYGGGSLIVNSISFKDSTGAVLGTYTPAQKINEAYSVGNDAFTFDNAPMTDIAKICVNITYTKCTADSNGKVTFNSDGGWKEVAYGTGSQAVGGMTASTPTDIFLEVGEVTNWFSIGLSEYGGGSLTINSVKLYDSNDAVISSLPYVAVTKNSIKVAESENGTVSVDKTTAAEGDTVTITAKAADGYEVDTITVTGASGDVDVAEDGTFKMPAEAVTVTATFKAVESDDPTDDNPTDDNPTDDNPTDDDPADDKPTTGEAVTYDPVVPDTTVSFVPANSAKKFEITDPVTGKTISTSVNKLAKALSKLTEGSDLAFDTGSFGIVLRKNVIKEIVDNDLTLVVKTSKATFIIDAENLAKVKTINIPAIMKTSNFKKLVKEGNTFNVIVTEKNKVEIELA